MPRIMHLASVVAYIAYINEGNVQRLAAYSFSRKRFYASKSTRQNTKRRLIKLKHSKRKHTKRRLSKRRQVTQHRDLPSKPRWSPLERILNSSIGFTPTTCRPLPYSHTIQSYHTVIPYRRIQCHAIPCHAVAFSPTHKTPAVKRLPY